MVKILDEVQQKAIYNGWLTGASKTALAQQFNVSARTIGRVINRKLAQVSGVPEEKGCKTKV